MALTKASGGGKRSGESMAAGKTAPGKATRRGTALAKASSGGKLLGESVAAGKDSPGENDSAGSDPNENQRRRKAFG